MFDRVDGAGLWPGQPRVAAIQGDLLSKGDLTAAIRAHGVGAVLHVAAPHPNGDDRALFQRVNVDGTATVIAACLEAGVSTLVYTSSASVVWQGAAQAGCDESLPYPAAFRDAYAETKAAAERLVLEAGAAHPGRLHAIALRPHAIWGPRDPQMVGTTVAVAKAGRMRAIVGDGSNVVDWTYVGNVVHGHLLALQAGRRASGGGGGGGGGGKDKQHAAAAAATAAACPASGRAFFITNGEPMPFWRFMNWMVLAFGYDVSTRRLPLAPLVGLATLVGWVLRAINSTRPPDRRINLTFSAPRLQIAGTHHWYSIAAAQRLLGYAPLWSLKEGLYLTVKAFPQLRNPAPSAAVLAKARAGGLTAAGLIRDPAPPPPHAKRAGASSTLGANSAWRDPASLPEYSASQVAAHCRRDDVWVVIRGLVYDVTPFVDDHPGGDEILKHAGGDATAGFFGPQHPDHVTETVRKYLIGRLRS